MYCALMVGCRGLVIVPLERAKLVSFYRLSVVTTLLSNSGLEFGCKHLGCIARSLHSISSYVRK